MYEICSSRWESSGGEANAILSRDSHQELYASYKQSSSTLSVLLYKEVLTKYTSLKFNALSTHLLNNQMVFFDKNVSIALSF